MHNVTGAYMTAKPQEPKALKQIAAREIKRLIESLPSELRDKLKSVAVVLEFEPSKDQIASGIEKDNLGLFLGSSLRDGEDGSLLPRQIILFLKNIRDEARESGRSYGEELRRTFLHELGHYLGLEEQDLKLRDVD